MPGQSEQGQQEAQKGGEERETKTDKRVPMQGAQLTCRCRNFPFEVTAHNKDSSLSLSWEPPALPLPAGRASLWIPIAPKALSGRTEGT